MNSKTLVTLAVILFSFKSIASETETYKATISWNNFTDSNKVSTEHEVMDNFKGMMKISPNSSLKKYEGEKREGLIEMFDGKFHNSIKRLGTSSGAGNDRFKNAHEILMIWHDLLISLVDGSSVDVFKNFPRPWNKELIQSVVHNLKFTPLKKVTRDKGIEVNLDFGYSKNDRPYIEVLNAMYLSLENIPLHFLSEEQTATILSHLTLEFFYELSHLIYNHSSTGVTGLIPNLLIDREAKAFASALYIALSTQSYSCLIKDFPQIILGKKESDETKKDIVGFFPKYSSQGLLYDKTLAELDLNRLDEVNLIPKISSLEDLTFNYSPYKILTTIELGKRFPKHLSLLNLDISTLPHDPLRVSFYEYGTNKRGQEVFKINYYDDLRNIGEVVSRDVKLLNSVMFGGDKIAYQESFQALVIGKDPMKSSFEYEVFKYKKDRKYSSETTISDFFRPSHKSFIKGQTQASCSLVSQPVSQSLFSK